MIRFLQIQIANRFVIIMMNSKHVFGLLLVLLHLYTGGVFAQDTSSAILKVEVDKSAYQPGDTVWLGGAMNESFYAKRALTMNVWIESVNKSGRWKLRYPLLYGAATAGIVLPKDMPADYYAFNINVQYDFFNISGGIEKGYKQDSIRFTMLSEWKDIVEGTIPVNKNSRFRMAKLLFEGNAVFFFNSQDGKTRKLPPVSIISSLDSPFVPIYDTTLLVKVGKVDDDVRAGQYQFDMFGFLNPETGLENVTVVAKAKTALQKLDEEYVRSPLFGGDNGYAFSGDDIQNSGGIDALNFLRGRVAGLQIGTGPTGETTVQWRGSATTLFLDEMQVDAVVLSGVPATDIALIKVFRPPFFGAFGGGPGGAIAVYTKRGSSSSNEPNRLRFVMYGYTPMLYQLPVRE